MTTKFDMGAPSIFLLLGLCTTCCGTPGVYYETSELREITEEFRQRASEAGREAHIDNLDSVEFTQFKTNPKTKIKTNGKCRYATTRDRKAAFGESTIVVDREFWNSASWCDRRMLLFHELVHCSFDGEPHDSASGRMMSEFPPFFLPEGLCTIVIEEYFKGNKK